VYRAIYKFIHINSSNIASHLRKRGRKENSKARTSAIKENSFQTSCTKAQLPKDTKVQRHKSTRAVKTTAVETALKLRKQCQKTSVMINPHMQLLALNNTLDQRRTTAEHDLPTTPEMYGSFRVITEEEYAPE
jgi:hypothetical protein